MKSTEESRLRGRQDTEARFSSCSQVKGHKSPPTATNVDKTTPLLRHIECQAVVRILQELERPQHLPGAILIIRWS